MNEDWDPQLVKKWLDFSLDGLDQQSTLACLRSARLRALERHKSQKSSLLAWVGERVFGSIWEQRLNYFVYATLLLVSLAGGATYWQQSIDNDTSDIDIAVLTDELPVQYYLD